MALGTTLNPWLNAREFCELLGIHPNTAWKWRHAGRGPRYYQSGENGVIRYRASDVESYIEANTSRPAKKARG